MSARQAKASGDAGGVLYDTDRAVRAEGFFSLCGVDEAGRGPLAGPVCAAAVILPPELVLPGLNDSKKLSAARRETLYGLITRAALSYGVAFATVAEIEELNILGATYLAMNRAIAALKPAPDLALIDGNQTRGIHFPCRALIRGDSLSASVAAASILAKVTRDRAMETLSELYPAYGFARHKGYGTAAHCAALREFGPCPEHRKKFLCKLDLNVNK